MAVEGVTGTLHGLVKSCPNSGPKENPVSTMTATVESGPSRPALLVLPSEASFLDMSFCIPEECTYEMELPQWVLLLCSEQFYGFFDRRTCHRAVPQNWHVSLPESRFTSTMTLPPHTLAVLHYYPSTTK
jgi:hypothetical protein